MGFRVSLHGSKPKPLMSALGQKRTFGDVRRMSALPPKADMDQWGCDVRFVPILLQKSGTTGHRGWRELLELAACYPLPNKGMV